MLDEFFEDDLETYSPPETERPDFSRDGEFECEDESEQAVRAEADSETDSKGDGPTESKSESESESESEVRESKGLPGDEEIASVYLREIHPKLSRGVSVPKAPRMADLWRPPETQSQTLPRQRRGFVGN